MYSITERIQRFYKRFPITAIILTINMVMVFFVIILGGFTTDHLISLGAMKPIRITENHEYYRLIMPMFLHGSFFHFLANSYFIYIIGPFVERLLGKSKYLAIYLLSGLGSSLLIWWLGNPYTTTIGASGAIFGILGALLLLTYLKPSWFTPMMIKNIRFITLFNLIFTFIMPNISILGHLGGFITGLILIYFLIPNRPSLSTLFKKHDKPKETIIIDDDEIYYHE